MLQLIYSPQTVEHMLSGKAVSRAVRGHLLLYAALSGVLLAKALDVPLPSPTEPPDDSAQLHPIIVEAKQLYQELMRQEDSAALPNVSSSEILTHIQQLLCDKTASIDSRTAKLWLMYMDMVRTLMKFIKAERMGKWELHLQAVAEMLPYLAASGHSLYAKSARVYLQYMASLKEEHADVYQRFSAGYHVARRSNRPWAGLSTDLMIEQVLMRSMKTSGGLTRGRGMKEQQRLIWLLSMPVCADVNRAMQDLTGVKYNSGEQNKDMGKTRQTRDTKDVNTLLTALSDRDPFDTDSDDVPLKNIITGMHASNAVNVEDSRAVGVHIMESMTNQRVTKYIFKRNDQAVTMASKSAVKIGNEEVQVDPHLLFQRLVVAAKSSDNTEEMFKYELCSHPPALFDTSLMMREAQKSLLAEAMWSKLPVDIQEVPTDDVQYVLDGGALLHRIPWPHGCPTYREVCSLYCDYVTRRYGKAIVVFDGYSTPSTKDMTHQRRTKGKVGAGVTFTDEMQVTQKKEVFLANKRNKEKFLQMLTEYLKLVECPVLHAEGDADRLIVEMAVKSSSTTDTILVGDDTDLLVLLCYHADLNSKDIFMHSQTRSKHRMWNIKAVKRELGESVCDDILFIHAILGCDTTSRLYGIGKSTSLKKYINSPHFRDQAASFRGSDQTTAEIVTAGAKALVSLYNGKAGDDLDKLRYRKFCEKVATKSSQVLCQSLPPTSASAKFHSMRVYLQIQQWKGVCSLSAVEWGWRLSDGLLAPVMTDIPPAPEALLRIIRCNCMTDCSTSRCSCRKNNLECSPACGHCRGSGCSNSTMADVSDSDDDYSDGDDI